MIAADLAPSPTLDRLREIQDLIGPAVLLPITPGTKAPGFAAWQQTTLADMDRPEYRKRFGPRHNVGVLQGEPSKGLCSADLDADEWVEPFLAVNPKLTGSLRTRRSRGWHTAPDSLHDYGNWLRDEGSDEIAEQAGCTECSYDVDVSRRTPLARHR